MSRRRDRTLRELLDTFTDTATGPRTAPEPGACGASGHDRQARHPGRRINTATAPRRGHRAAGRGWCPVEAPLVTYQTSTHEIGAWFPFLAADPLPPVGARMGYDVISGSSFHAHPIEWVLRGLASNPNIITWGEPGLGKTSTIAALAARLACFGVKLWVAGDVKGEYSPLVRALGGTPIALGHANGARLNALDLGPLAARWPSFGVARQRAELDGVLARWTTLLLALAQAQGAAPTVTDEAVLSAALRDLTGAADGATQLREVTIPTVARALADPSEHLWRDTRFASARHFLDHTRPLTDALRNLCAGPLAGLFDAPTTLAIDWSAPAQSLDLSGLRARGDRAIAIALTCLGSWSSLITEHADAAVRIVIRDEVWRQLQLGLRAVQTIDAELRLSRLDRAIQVLIGHKPSDPLTAGATGSQEVAITKDLYALCGIRILCGQSTRVADDLADDFGLSGKEQDSITGWATERRGRALWKLHSQPGRMIQTVLSTTEKALLDTNAALQGTHHTQATARPAEHGNVAEYGHTGARDIAEHATRGSHPRSRTGAGPGPGGS